MSASRHSKLRVVVVHPPFGPGGGGELLAAWVLQALATDYAVTLVCVEPVDWTRVDTRFGTTLATADVTVRTPSPAWRSVLRRWPNRADRLRRALLERLSAQLAVSDGSELWVSTCDEMRLPRPGLQYIHSPTPGTLPDEELAWIGSPPSLQRAYQTLCRLVAGTQLSEHRRNLTLVNSQYSAGIWWDLNRLPSEVVYPPVPPLTSGGPWNERVDRVVCLGRLFLGKGLERVVDIVAGARARGAGVTLAVAGKWACEGTERSRLEQLFRARPWIELYQNPSRAELAELVSNSRYGIHGMKYEPFGIAVAELQDSGVITFAPATGGPREIVDDERLLYRDETDGVEKFMRVWSDPALQEDVRRQAATRAGRFSPARFMDRVRAHVAAVMASQQPPIIRARSA